MFNRMSGGPGFWEELRKRRVVRVAIVYAVASWTIVEGSETLTSILELPPATPRLVLALAVLGFPLALAVTWALQVTPGGIRREGRFEPGGAASRIPLIAGMAVGLLAIGGVALLVFPRDDPHPGGPAQGDANPDVVAVLPLRVTGASPEVSHLAIGLQELLSTRLDGEVGPRSVAPAAVAAAIHGRDVLDELVVARSLGADLSISGSVVGTGSHVVVEAQLTGPESEARIPARAEGHPDSLAMLANQLVAGLLSLGSGEYRESVANLTSREPLALKAYLQGKAAWRAGLWYDAVQHFGRAMDLDSTFALAGLARADGLNMAIGAESRGGLELAWRHRDRLGARDRRYLEARRPEGPRTWAERLAAYEQLTRELPDRLEPWYWLLEERLHYRNDLSPDWFRTTKLASHRALELNPRYFPALEHLLVLELSEGNPDTLQALAVHYFEIRGNTNPVYRGLAAGSGLLEFDSVALGQPDVDPNWVWTAPAAPILWPDRTPGDPAAAADAALGVLLSREGTIPLFSTSNVAGVAYRVHAALGRPQRARSAYARQGLPDPPELIHFALWDRVFVDEAEGAVRASVARLAGDESLTPAGARELTAAEAWRYMTEPGYASTDAPTRILAAAADAPHPVNLEMEAHALLLLGWSQLRNGASTVTATLDRLDGLLAEGPGVLGTQEHRGFLLLTAAVYEELGLFDRALRTLERRSYVPAVSHEVEILRRMGRYAEALGDTARARQEYGRYLRLRSDVEPAVSEEVEAVRVRLAGLSPTGNR